MLSFSTSHLRWQMHWSWLTLKTAVGCLPALLLFSLFLGMWQMRTWKTGCWEDIGSSQTKSLVISTNRGTTFPSNKMQEWQGETRLRHIFLGCFVTIIYNFKDVLCVHDSTRVLRLLPQARMGEKKGLVRQVHCLLEVPLPCTWVFNSVHELAQ